MKALDMVLGHYLVSYVLFLLHSMLGRFIILEICIIICSLSMLMQRTYTSCTVTTHHFDMFYVIRSVGKLEHCCLFTFLVLVDILINDFMISCLACMEQDLFD